MEQSKKSFTEKIKQRWDNAKQFCVDHKKELVTVGITVILGYFGIKKSENNNSDDEYSYNRLYRMSYDELHEMRDDVLTNIQGERRVNLLERIDRALSRVTNPRAEHARSLSDEELQSELENARNLFYKEEKKYHHDKRPFKELIKDEDYKKYQRIHDNFYRLKVEKESRYAKAHPDQFPRHKEHGWYLPEDDD